MKKFAEEREQLNELWEQERIKMKETEVELQTHNENLQKKLEASALMEKDMNVSFANLLKRVVKVSDASSF